MAGFDRVAGTVELYLDPRAERRGRSDLSHLREGDRARIDGPLGRGFDVDARSRHVLVVSDVAGVAGIRALVLDMVAAGRQVTVLLGARSAQDVLPSTLLPDEAEYVVATEDGSLGHRGSVIDLVPTYEAWADQCFAAGSADLLTRLAVLAAGRDQRMGVARLERRPRRDARPTPTRARRKAWLQVVLPHPAGCALGVCLGCVAQGTSGPVRVCREGPAFASHELRWAEVP